MQRKMDEVELASEIHSACRDGDLGKVKELLEKGAPRDTSRFGYSDTLMHEAVFSGNLELVTFLSGFIQVDSPGRRCRRPLHVAADYNNLGMVRHLLNLGAYPTVMDDDGIKPAELTRNPDIVNALEAKERELTQAKPKSSELQDIKEKEKEAFGGKGDSKPAATAKRRSTRVKK